MTIFMPVQSTTERARQLLDQLGTTPGDVARTLTAGGHTGPRGFCSTCPVATYLMASDLAVTDVAVGETTISLFYPIDGEATDHIDVSLPPAVREFVAMFDNGQFPALVAEGRAA